MEPDWTLDETINRSLIAWGHSIGVPSDDVSAAQSLRAFKAAYSRALEDPALIAEIDASAREADRQIEDRHASDLAEQRPSLGHQPRHSDIRVDQTSVVHHVSESAERPVRVRGSQSETSMIADDAHLAAVLTTLQRTYRSTAAVERDVDPFEHTRETATAYVVDAIEGSGAAKRWDFDISAIVTVSHAVVDGWDFSSIEPEIFWRIAAHFIKD